MLSICRWMGLILIVVGIVIMLIGKKSEGSELAALQERRNRKLDERILELHGSIPRKSSKEVFVETEPIATCAVDIDD